MYLGIDGGGTKTAGVILSEEGRVLARAGAAGTAFVGEPPEEVKRRIGELAGELLRHAGTRIGAVRRAAAGMNGVDFADELEVQRAGIAQALEMDAGKLSLVNDAIAGLWGASASPAAVLLQHGSGITSAYRGSFGEEQLYDHLDSGKLFDLRHAAITLVARMIDGREKPTSLKEDVLRHVEVRDEGGYSEAVFRGHIDHGKRAGMAAVVFRAGERGDPAALELIRSALKDYALTARAMVAKAGCDKAEIAFGGGVIDNLPAGFWDELAKRTRELCPGCAVRRPLLRPETGAGIMAAFLDGHDPEAFYRRLGPPA